MHSEQSLQTYTVLVQAVDATDDSPTIPEHTTVKTPMNMTVENKAHFEAEKEAIHLILTGIGDEIYSTVDACQTAQEMWEAIEWLQQGESLNIQDVKTNLFWEFAIPEHTTVKTPMNMSPENKSHFEAKKEAIHLILTGIGDEIYSTVDACQTA
nr:hypothetical protein [Tanacetum cinerariifolium]